MDMDGILAVDRAGRCYICHRILSSEIQTRVDLERMSICSDCKYLFLEDSISQQRTHSTALTRYNSSLDESIENMLSQRLPDSISDHRNQSRQWTRVLSDTESEDFDSVFGDSDVFSYAAYGSDSDASVVFDDDDDDDDDDHDDDDDDDDDEFEEVENTVGSFVGRIQLQRSLATNGRNLPHDWLSEILSDEGIRNGETREPASAAALFVKSLDIVVVDEELVCVICKDNVLAGCVMSRLPCGHVYHPSCIMPWLNEKNTCPLCRYELQTDDKIEGVNEYALSQGNNESGGGRWWFVAAPLVSMVGVGVVLWLGGGVFGGQRDNRSGRWWAFL